MNSKIISLITTLTLSFSVSFASTNVKDKAAGSYEGPIITFVVGSPAEADFSDPIPEANASSAILVPVTPKEATFDDDDNQEVTNEDSLLNSLSPSTPVEAGFEEPF